MTRPLDLDDIFSVRAPSDPQLSPDGTRVAFVVTTADRDKDENRSSIWVVDAAGDGEARPLTDGPSDSAPRWSPDGTELAFVAAGRGEKTELRVLPMTGGESRVIAEGPGMRAPAWSPDGTRLLYVAIVGATEAHEPVVVRRLGYKADGAGLIGEKRGHVFVVAANGGEPRQLTEGDFSVAGAPAWSPDGARIAWISAVEEDRDLEMVTSLFATDAGGGDAIRVTDPPFIAAAVAWMPDGKGFVISGRERMRVGHTSLWTLPSSGGAPVRIAADFDRNVMIGGPGYPGSPPKVNDDGTRIVFCARDAGATHVYATTLDGAAEKLPKKLCGDDTLNISGVAVDAAQTRLVVVASTPTNPGELYVDGVRRTRLWDNDIEVVEPVARTFTAPDGTPIHGWVLRRDDAVSPGPLLLDIHGGPHNAWNASLDLEHMYHQTLAQQGWTVLFVNPRGSDGYGEEFFRAVAGAWGTSDSDDFLCAVDALVADGTVDPARVAVTGYSYGGYMACWLTATTDRFAAAVTGGCVSNMISDMATSDLGYYLAWLEMGGGPGAENIELMQQLSPITYVDSVTATTLILHGENDDRCDIGQAEEWFGALRSRRVETEMVRYPGASHLFILNGRPSHRIDYNRRVTDWVTTHVKS
jgi:dipeptidyl aminopeptidase/acylaminoacyl peptidase